MTDEERLFERVCTYEPQALEKLYDAYAPLIYAYLYRRLQDAPLAEDLTSEVFLRLLRAFRSREVWHTSLRGWLYRVAHNLVMDHYRQQVPNVTLDEGLSSDPDTPDTDDVEEQVSEWCTRRQLRAALKRLTPEQQEVLALRFGEQLSTQETAEVMGKSVSAIEALQHRALATLRRMLKSEL